jgi:hypothetical protein
VLATAAAPAASAAVTTAYVRHHQVVKVADGNVELGSPLQSAQFVAVTGLGRNHGYINYTNWAYDVPGSGVWAPASQADTLSFYLPATPTTVLSTHQLNSGLVLRAVSPSDVRFTGSGEQLTLGSSPVTGVTWTIAGEVRGLHVTYTITYTGLYKPYTVVAKGLINPADGSAKGTSDAGGTPLNWSLPAGSFVSVFHFVAPVKDARITLSGRTALFDFVIPAGNPLTGTEVTVFVHAGGSPAADVWKHAVGPLTSYPGGAGLTQYPVLAGFISVF